MGIQFKDKVALVTGAATGIGKATAIEFAKNDAKVVIADWKDASDTVNEIKKIGGEAIYVKCDVSNEADVKTVVDTAVATYGSVDFGFNNAGIEIAGDTPIEKVTAEDFDKLININLKGVFFSIKHEAIQMLKQGKGVIVNTASVAGLVAPLSNLSGYVASKHGVVGLTKAAALDFGKRGIRINAICPGAIRTPMFQAALDESPEARLYVEQQILGRVAEPQEIADAVMWLCSDASSFVHGAAIPIDGGMTAQ